MSYDVFISYSHAADGKLAPALQNALQRFVKPWHKRRALRIFRDETTLSASPHLWGAIQQALAESRYFLLLASPGAAGSRWVQQEVAWWLAHKSAQTLLIGLTDGQIVRTPGNADFDWTRTNALPPSLAGVYEENPLWVDLRWARNESQLSDNDPRFQNAVANLAAPVHGRAKDDLIGEDVRQHRRTRRVAGAAIATLAVLLVVAILAAVEANQARDTAIAARATAEWQADVSLTQALSLQSSDLAEGRPDLALLLAVEAIRIADAIETDTLEARGSLLEVLQSQPRLDRYLQGHGASVRDIGFDIDTGTLVSGDDNGTVIVWDSDSGKPRHILEGHNGKISVVQLSSDGGILASAGCAHVKAGGECEGGEILLWDVESGTQLARLPAHGGMPKSLVFAPDGSTLLSFGTGPAMAEWDISSRPISSEPIAEVEDLNGDEWYLSPDLSIIAILNGDTLHLVDDKHDEARVLERSASGSVLQSTSSAVFSSDGTGLVAGYLDGTVVLWDIERAQEVAVLAGGIPSPVIEVAYSPDDVFVAARHADGTVEIWDIESHERQGEPLVGHGGGARGITFGSDEHILYTVGADGGIARWNLGASQRMGDILVQASLLDVTDVAVSLEDMKVATLAPELAVWELNSRQPVTEEFAGPQGLAGMSFIPNCVAFSPDGTTLSARSADGTIYFWDVATGRLDPDRIVDAGSEGSPNCLLAFSPDGRTLATASTWADAVILIDVKSGRPHHSPLQVSIISRILFSPDGKLLTIPLVGDPILWDMIGGSPVSESLAGYSTQVVDAAFSSDGDTLVTVSIEGQIMERELSHGPAQPRLLTTHSAPLSSVAISPDGSLLATGDGKGRIILWVAATGQPLGQPMVHGGTSVKGVAFSADGTVLVSWTMGEGMLRSSSSSVMLWDVNPESWKKRACDIAGRNLTDQEWSLYLGGELYRLTCEGAPASKEAVVGPDATPISATP
jgi:WD40 repeat protein